jgi:hypothetical protein
MLHGQTVKLNQVPAVEEKTHAENYPSESVRRDVDIISQFRANLNQLEDLQGRLRYVMSEVAYIVKKRT